MARRERAGTSEASGGARPLSNKAGQQLGLKGRDTRSRLLDAAERLLQQRSPFALTTAAVAKEAGTSSATFYVYFDDIRELLLDLSADCGPKLEDLFPRDDMLMHPARLEGDARAFIAAVNLAWDRHAPVLLYRNLEADRGERSFDEIRTATARPILRRLRQVLMNARASEPPFSEDDAQAEAVVLFAAVERIAATTHRTPENGPPPEDLRAALVRLLVRSLAPASNLGPS